MKREIKFKAKAIENLDHPNVKIGEWVYGHSLSQYESGRIEVNGVYCDTDTLCQYTGVKDKNGKDIYEGDIVQWKMKPFVRELIYTKVIKWEYFQVDVSRPNCRGWYNIDSSMEVVGNVFDNPDLLTDK